MRRREKPHGPLGRGDVPAEFLIGPCVEVWGDESKDSPPISAAGNFSRSRSHWLAACGVGPHETDHPLAVQSKARPAPYSVQFMQASGRGQIATSYLEAGGVEFDDLRALRAVAQQRVAATRVAAA